MTSHSEQSLLTTPTKRRSRKLFSDSTTPEQFDDEEEDIILKATPPKSMSEWQNPPSPKKTSVDKKKSTKMKKVLKKLNAPSPIKKSKVNITKTRPKGTSKMALAVAEIVKDTIEEAMDAYEVDRNKDDKGTPEQEQVLDDDVEMEQDDIRAVAVEKDCEDDKNDEDVVMQTDQPTNKGQEDVDMEINKESALKAPLVADREEERASKGIKDDNKGQEENVNMEVPKESTEIKPVDAKGQSSQSLYPNLQEMKDASLEMDIPVSDKRSKRNVKSLLDGDDNADLETEVTVNPVEPEGENREELVGDIDMSSNTIDVDITKDQSQSVVEFSKPSIPPVNMAKPPVQVPAPMEFQQEAYEPGLWKKKAEDLRRKRKLNLKKSMVNVAIGDKRPVVTESKSSNIKLDHMISKGQFIPSDEDEEEEEEDEVQVDDEQKDKLDEQESPTSNEKATPTKKGRKVDRKRGSMPVLPDNFFATLWVALNSPDAPLMENPHTPETPYKLIPGHHLFIKLKDSDLIQDREVFKLYSHLKASGGRFIYFKYEFGKPETFQVLHLNKHYKEVLKKRYEAMNQKDKDNGIKITHLTKHANYLEVSTKTNEDCPIKFHSISPYVKTPQTKKNMVTDLMKDGKCIVNWCYTAEQRSSECDSYKNIVYNYGVLNGKIKEKF